MPAPRLKQYKAVIAAASSPQTSSAQAVAPANPDRIFLVLQNNGANPAFVQFNNPVKGDGSDLNLSVGGSFQFDQINPDGSFNGPTGAIYIAATAATTVALIEGTRIQ